MVPSANAALKVTGQHGEIKVLLRRPFARRAEPSKGTALTIALPTRHNLLKVWRVATSQSDDKGSPGVFDVVQQVVYKRDIDSTAWKIRAAAAVLEAYRIFPKIAARETWMFEAVTTG